MHTLLISIASIIHGVICAYFLMESNQPFEIFKLNIVLFYIRGAVTCLLFLKLAKNWPQLIKDFENVEIYLNNFPTSKRLVPELRIFTFTILFCAAVEHFSVHCMNFLIAYNCENNLLGILRRFFAYINYRQVFTYIHYNIFLGVFLQILNLSVTFGWTYADIFIIYTSRNFSEKLVQLKNQIYLTINEGIKRFILEVSVYPMILSGNKYFYITRDLILKIAGSIVTYELIMFQFSNDISEPPESPQC
ncbi:hypothetical protein WA026_017087 [Henosepilachna vigintioctopunctata]|uniref:Gustatory receptor n=1 Tax=Henosepilachna vigintioctopunctata TaxID=420089 RepID=A0AAW1TWV0_9CUCU